MPLCIAKLPPLSSLATVLMVVLFNGCSGSDVPELAPVTGSIQMGNTPLANATVTFIPENGRPSSGVTDSSGDYTLYYNEKAAGAVPGVARVMISTGTAPVEDADGNVTQGQPETVPMEYNSMSTLTYDVKPKEKNRADFKLVAGGSVVRAAKGEENLPDSARFDSSSE